MKKIINKTVFDINRDICNRIQEELGFDDEIMEEIMCIVKQGTIMAYERGYQEGEKKGHIDDEDVCGFSRY
jgi:hypothetical protein